MYNLIDWKFYKTVEVSNEDILFLLNKSKSVETTILELEDKNFKVYSKDWKKKTIDWVKVLINKKEDITEFLDWDFKWEQLFTFDAMIRETKKVWKKVPTKDEWWQIIKYINPNIRIEWWWQDDTSVRERLWLKLAGYRYRSNAYYYGRGWYGNYWSSSPNSIYGYGVNLNSTQVYPLIYNFSSYGFSVRCLKN